MMRLLATLGLGLFAAACTPAIAPPHEPIPPASPADGPPSDPAPHIAAIERGLLPKVRVAGRDQRWALADRMREHHVPGLAVAVIERGQVAWSRVYGVSDADTGAPATDRTLFQAGSISKAVTALGVLGAADKGELDLDRPINELLTGWKLPDNDLTARAPVTLRRLLSHTAGTTVHGFPGYEPTAPLPTLVQVLDGTPPANTAPVRVDLLPGKEFRYSGGGITIVQKALVDRFDKPFANLLHDRVLAPLGMERSTFEEPLPAAWLADAAAGHDEEGKPIRGKRHVYPEMAAAGLWTTPSDLARFLVEVERGVEGRSTVVSRRVAEWMTTPAASLGAGDHVGLGLFLRSENGFVYFGHNGTDAGFQAVATARLGRGYGAVLMANSEHAQDLLDEVKRAIAVEYGWEGTEPPIAPVHIAPEALAALTGRFATGLIRPFILSARGESLWLARPFAEPVELVPVSADTFIAVNDGARCHITVNDVACTRKEGTEKAARLSPEARPPLLFIAAGDHDGALAALRDFQAHDPKSPAISEKQLDALGSDLFYRRHDREHGLLVFVLATELYPDSIHTYASLAHAYEAAGDKVKAIATYKAGLDALGRDTTMSPERRKKIEEAARRQIESLGAP
ncbi:MAG: serine hydrolase [Byssovorax sp.]